MALTASARGGAYALVTVTIWAGWPVVTRLSVTDGALAPMDLVWLRFTVGALFLAPVLLRHANRPPRPAWLGTGVLMAACQGAPLALLLAAGLYYAPAAHASALAPGVMPLFATALGMILLGEHLNARRAVGLGLIVVGAATLAGIGAVAGPPDRPLGHALFMAAALLGAMYTVLLRRSGLSPLQGVALVTLYSAAVCLPLPLLLDGGTGLAHAPAPELIVQATYQGLLMGVVALVCLGRAILLLGAGRATAYIALDPVLTIIIAAPAGEVPTAADVAAAVLIAGGVFLATRQTGDGPVDRVMPRPVARSLRPGSPDSTVAA